MSAYTMFVKRFFSMHKGKGTPQQLMKACASAWRSHSSGGAIMRHRRVYHRRRRLV